MSETKKKPEEQKESEEEKIEKSIQEAYKKGFIDGSQEVYKTYSTFLQNRMLSHLESRKDELAKEIRDIYLLNKAGMKKPLT
jgi:flagellar biosynthesis/type III secretory pathway protein FliH